MMLRSAINFEKLHVAKTALPVCIVRQTIAISLPEMNCIHDCTRLGLLTSAAVCTCNIPSALVPSLRHIFPEHEWEQVDAELQAQQAKAMLLRRKGRIHFHGDSSTMICPGEITVARRPV